MVKSRAICEGGREAIIPPTPLTERMGAPYRSGFVALVGRPNVGKSTLLNRLVGRPVSITARKPQTTRNRVMGVRHGPGYQIVFVDTPGIHRPELPLNVRMVRYATRALAEAELVLAIVEPRGPAAADREVLERVRASGRPAFLLVNKVDAAAEADVLEALRRYGGEPGFAELVPLSALTGRNVERLERLIAARLPEGPPYFEPGQVTDQPESQLIAELVRQEVFRRTSQEVPYKTAVRVERLDDRGHRLDVRACVYVERDSQKGILIGKGGRMLKAVGSAARRKIERLLGVHVFLGLEVRVLPDWSETPRHLDALGYPEE